MMCPKKIVLLLTALSPSHSFLRILSVLICHIARAHGGVDMMVGHTNAGASDLDRASVGLLGSTLALEDSLYLGGIDLEWLCRLAKKQEWEGGKDCYGTEEP